MKLRAHLLERVKMSKKKKHIYGVATKDGNTFTIVCRLPLKKLLDAVTSMDWIQFDCNDNWKLFHHNNGETELIETKTITVKTSEIVAISE